MMTKTTELQRHRLAQALAAARPDWDVQGIDRALRDAIDGFSESPFDLAIAAFKAAKQASNRTPAVIAMQGPHRQEAAPTTGGTVERPTCPVHRIKASVHPSTGELACCRAERIGTDGPSDTRRQPTLPPERVTTHATAARAAMEGK